MYLIVVFVYNHNFFVKEKLRIIGIAWRIPGTEKPGGLLSMGSHRVGHDWSDLAAAARAVPFLQMRKLKLSKLTSQVYFSVNGKTAVQTFLCLPWKLCQPLTVDSYMLLSPGLILSMRIANWQVYNDSFVV